jgi:hypothetical protein
MQLATSEQMAPEETTVSAARATPYWMYACPDGGGAGRGSDAAADAAAVGAGDEESSALAVEGSSPAMIVTVATAASVPGRGLFMRLRAYNVRLAHVAVDRPMAVRILGWP